MKRTSTAVVRPLGTRETALGPTIGGAVEVEEGVLLLETEPRGSVLCELHDFCGMVAVVGLVRGAIVVVALCEDEDVVATAEGVLEDGGGTEVDIGVAARGLVGGGTVEVPNAEGANVSDLLGDRLRAGLVLRSWDRDAQTSGGGLGHGTHRRLGTETAIAIDPDVCRRSR